MEKKLICLGCANILLAVSHAVFNVNPFWFLVAGLAYFAFSIWQEAQQQEEK